MVTLALSREHVRVHLALTTLQSEDIVAERLRGKEEFTLKENSLPETNKVIVTLRMACKADKSTLNGDSAAPLAWYGMAWQDDYATYGKRRHL